MSPDVCPVRTALGARAVQIDNAPLPITSSRMGHLRDALARAYRVLGLEQAPSKSKPARGSHTPLRKPSAYGGAGEQALSAGSTTGRTRSAVPGCDRPVG